MVMLLRIFTFAAAICAFSFAGPLAAQGDTPCTECYSAEQAREDLSALYATLQEEHVDLFARRSKAEYDALIQRLDGEIDGPIRRTDFHLMLHEAMAFGMIGHAKTEVAMADVFAHVGEGGTIIPLSVAYRGHRLYTDNWTGQAEALPPGSQIISIGGLSLEEFEARAAKIISADTARLLRSQIELGMPAYIYLILGPLEAVTVEYVTSDGTTSSHRIEAMPLGEMYALQAARPLPTISRDPEARLFRDLGDGVFYIQPGPFFATSEERGLDGDAYAIEPYRAFVETAFAALAESGARDLVIDLRNNGGGDASFSDLIIARLADRPYRYASRYVVRAGPVTKTIWADRDAAQEGLGGRVAEALQSAAVGERVLVDLPVTQPIEDSSFSGRAWVLVNRHSYSNAAVVAALMQDLGIATIIGEETADLPTTYGAVEQFQLPHSGATIVYPKSYMVRPSGSEEVRGVVPDFLIAPNAVLAQSDHMLETAKTQIILSR